KEAVRQCRECLASPYLMPSGHTVGENHAYMLRQLLALQRRTREHGGQRP
ncbi:NADH-quinone oxidoreductase subunit F, partial [Alistipes putredinis]